MLHRAQNPAAVREIARAVEQALSPGFGGTGNTVSRSARLTIAPADVNPQFLLIQRFSRPLIVRQLMFFQSGVPSGFEQVDVIFENNDRTTLPTGIGARYLSRSVNVFGEFRPIQTPTVLQFSEAIRFAPIFMKFCFRSSNLPTNTLTIGITVELA
jgi:hypothetical protein